MIRYSYLSNFGGCVMRSLTVLALAGLAASAASAADLPTYQPQAFVARVYDWSGIYIGVNAGYGFAQGTVSSSASALSITEDLNGAVGGGQFGANFQSGAFVIGLEVDAMASGQKR